MATMDFEACYTALGLPFGAGLKEVNERWRKLSRVHHPDQHMRDPKAYRQALEKQKQLNNARDLLKKWFDANPHSSPRKASSSSTQANSRDNSAASKAGDATKQSGHQSQSTNQKTSQSSGQSYGSQRQTQSGQYYWDHTKHSHNNSSSQSTTTSTGWFKTTDLKLTPLQEWVKKIDAYCNRPNSDSATGLAMALGFAAVFSPLWIITATLGLIFPELPGHYPEWLTPFLLGGSGFITTYLFRWYFSECEIIKLQEQARYFRTDRSIQNSIEYLKMTIEKQTRPNSQWKFLSSGTAQEAILEFEEEVLPDLKRSRRIVLRFEVKDSTVGRLVGLEIRTTSPINSFSCKKITESVLGELKKEFHEVAA